MQPLGCPFKPPTHSNEHCVLRSPEASWKMYQFPSVGIQLTYPTVPASLMPTSTCSLDFLLREGQGPRNGDEVVSQ